MNDMQPEPELINEPDSGKQPVLLTLWHNRRVRSFLLFLVAMVCIVVANIAGGVIGQFIAGKHSLASDMLYRLISTIVMILLFLVVARYVEQRYDDAPYAIGLPLWPGWLRETLLGALISFGLISIAVAAILLFGKIEMRAVINWIAARRAVEVTILLLFGAMLEELMFRGYPFQKLIDTVNPTGAILLLSALFGAVHLSNPNASGVLSWAFFNTIAVGVVFAIAYLRFRSLWLPFGMHFGWNFTLGVLYGLPVSGLSMFSVVVRSTTTGPKALTGGAYGIEASATGAVVILIGLGIVLALPARPLSASAAETPIAELHSGHPSGI